MGELTVSRAERVKQTLGKINPALEGMKEELEDKGERPVRDTGNLRQQLSARREEYDLDETPATFDLNLILGFLDYNNVLEVEGNVVWNKSSGVFTEFYPLTYDRDRVDILIDYLEEEIEEYKEDSHKPQENASKDFNDFDEYS